MEPVDNKKMSIKKCVRCRQLFNEPESIWEKPDSTLLIIARFNSTPILAGALGEIVLEDCFCPECQGLLPEMTVEKFKELKRH